MQCQSKLGRVLARVGELKPCLQAKDLAPGGGIPGQAPLLQQVQALVQHQQLRLLGLAGGYEDAVHHEGVHQLWRYRTLQMQQGILHSTMTATVNS